MDYLSGCLPPSIVVNTIYTLNCIAVLELLLGPCSQFRRHVAHDNPINQDDMSLICTHLLHLLVAGRSCYYAYLQYD